MLRLPIRKRATIAAGLLAVGSLGYLAGCETPPPPEAPVPAGVTYNPTLAPPKPMPDSATNPPADVAPGPYNDQPILDQRLPEEAYFLDAYNKIHEPRLAIYVNRTLTGQIIPANPVGPVDYSQSPPRYLAPGEYDEADLKTLDYQAIEKILTDWMACGGRVHIISSDYLAAQLSPDDLAALSQGRPIAMTNLADKVGADVLIQIQAHPTRQTDGLQVRLVAEAINVRGGDSIGNAVADVPLPLDKPQINDFTRFIAAKLMVGMANAWDANSQNPAPPPPSPTSPPPSAATSAPLPSVPEHLPPVPPPTAAAAPPASTQPAQEMNLIP